MDEESTVKQPLLKRKATRRALLGGAAGTAALAFAYAAFGDQLGNSSSGSTKSAAASAAPGATGGAPKEAVALQAEDVRISHLLRRTGFGTTKDEWDRYQQMGLDATLNELVNYQSVDDSEAEALADAIKVDGGNAGSGVAWWLTRILNTKRPLQEKMTFFWSGLLTSQISVVRDPVAMIDQNKLYRANALGVFPDILKAVTANPAMMVYLDIDGSEAQAPNENYARELMELFSLGEGNYTEEDVRQGARAFTGWRVPKTRGDNMLPKLGTPVFVPRRFDSGTKTFLGKNGNFKGNDVVDIITAQPASAMYITKRLFSFFVYENPDDQTLQPFVEVYNKSGRNIGATLEAMLRSDAFYSPQAYRALVKSPVEYIVGAVKALGLQGSAGRVINGNGPRGGGVFSDMGQIPMEPPNVAGWPGGASWLNSATMFARLNFINQIAGGQEQGGAVRRQQQPPQPSGASSLGTASQALDYYLPFLLDGNVPDAGRQVLLDYAGGADTPITPDKLRGLAYILLASPQYHLA